MLLLLLPTFLVSQATGYIIADESFDPEVDVIQDDYLVWPESYTIKAIRMSFMDDVTQSYEAWKTNTSSRVDYNDGAVKSIAKLAVNGSEPSKYEIHPEAEDIDETEFVCQNMVDSDLLVELDEILPKLEDNDYELVGNDTVLGIETSKFSYIDDSYDEKKTYFVWAYKETDEEDNDFWVPVRYEIFEYNNLLGAEVKHEVLYYSEFSTEVDEDVFDLDDYDCDSMTNKVTKDSEIVTKELMFINTENKHHVDHIFNSFKTKFGREYENENEHQLRKSIFKKNMRLISSINRKNLTYKLGVTQFADRTLEEINKKYTGLKRRSEGISGNIPFNYTEEKLAALSNQLPDAYDARIYGYVGPVKNQETCGSCWAFGSTGAIEGALARVNGGSLMSLSTQALVDCAWMFGVSGCDGGADINAYKFMMEYGLPTEEEYGPYKNKDDFCHIADMDKVYKIRGYTDVTPLSNTATKVALINNGPLSVSVEATIQFTLYSRGIYYEKDCGVTRLTHEVMLVGYGNQDGDLFWILKNSWGDYWGNAGYMQISAKDNSCGVTTEPTYVVI